MSPTLTHIAYCLLVAAALVTLLLWRMQQNAKTAVYDDEYNNDSQPEPQPCDEGIMKDILSPDLSNVHVTKYSTGECVFTNKYGGHISFTKIFNK